MIDILLAIETIENESEREFIGQLFEQYSQRIKKAAWKILENEEDAEDALVLTFIKVIKYRDKFIGIDDTRLRSRLHLITKCTCFDMLSKRNGLPVMSVSNAVEDDEGGMSDLEIPDDIDILEDVLREESVQILSQSIETLKSPAKEIVILRYYEGIPNVEIADLLSMNPSTVGTILQRALNKLKKELVKYYDDKK